MNRESATIGVFPGRSSCHNNLRTGCCIGDSRFGISKTCNQDYIPKRFHVERPSNAYFNIILIYCFLVMFPNVRERLKIAKTTLKLF